RYQQYRGARVSKFDQFSVNELSGPDIHSASRLSNQHKARLDVELARDDELLLISARQRSRRQRYVWWPNVVLSHESLGPLDDDVVVQQYGAGDGTIAMHPENAVACKIERKQQSPSMPILWNVSDATPLALMWIKVVYASPFE